MPVSALSNARGFLSDEQYGAAIEEIVSIPAKIESIVQSAAEILDLSRAFRFASSFLFLGRGYNFPVALEGALKLKEISYIHAEGYAAAEMKHGPIALIDKFMPVVVVAPRCDEHYSKLKANIQEVKCAGIAVASVVNRRAVVAVSACSCVS